MSLANMRLNGVRMVTASCEARGHKADVNVDTLPESVHVPDAGHRLRCSRCGGKRVWTRPAWRRGLRGRLWLWSRRVELSPRGTQRIKARRVGKAVDCDGAPERRCHRSKLVVGEVNHRHALIAPRRGSCGQTRLAAKHHSVLCGQVFGRKQQVLRLNRRHIDDRRERWCALE
jgi:hypothetical protein